MPDASAPVLFVLAGDEALQHVTFDPPVAVAAHLDRGEFTGPHERVRLARRNVEDLGDVDKRQKAPEARRIFCIRGRHASIMRGRPDAERGCG